MSVAATDHSRPLRVGIVGIGTYAMGTNVPNLRRTGRAEVVAIARRDPLRLRIAQEALGVPQAYTDWQDLIERAEIDAVVVGTPHHAHARPTIAALDRGLHVLVDKPLALTSADARAMVEAGDRAAAHGRVLVVGYANRLNGLWRAAKQALAAGEIGTVRQVCVAWASDHRWFWEAETLPEAFVRAQAGRGVPEPFFGDRRLEADWRREPDKMGGGMFADRGAHNVNVALWLADAAPAEVVAFGENAGLPVECFLTVQGRLDNGVLVSFAAASGVAGGNELRVLVFGDRGTMEVTGQGTSPTAVVLHRDGASRTLAPLGPSMNAAEHFVACALDGAANLSPAPDAARAVAFAEATYRSLAARQPVAAESPSPRPPPSP